MPREQILPLFASRPLALRMLRGGRVEEDVAALPPPVPGDAITPAAPEPAVPVVAGFPPPGAEIVEVTFLADDRPPLGLDMDWQNPPQVLQVMPDTPAARRGVQAGDQLYRVSGQDVTMMRREEILPLFGARPVLLELVRVGASSGPQEALPPEIVEIDFDKEDQNP